MPGKFELKRFKKKFRFELKASNGRVILISELYGTKRAAENGIRSVKKNARADKNYDRRQAGKKTYFVVVARNGEIIGTSQMYTSTGGRQVGIRSVKKNASGAKVLDWT